MAAKRLQHACLLVSTLLLVGLSVVGCGPSGADLAALDFALLAGDDWEVSTPEEQGLDPSVVARLYHDAAQLELIRGLLVVEGSKLIAEGPFNGVSIDRKDNRHSVTKSYTSALVGLALEEGCLSSIDQKMLDFFPELADQVKDPRKRQITIRQMLQMRAGYPSEETDPALNEAL